MDFLARAYLIGTNPNSAYSDLACPDVAFSILYHTVLYIIAIVLFYYFWLGSCILTAIPQLFCFFLVVMMIGYPSRLYRAKTLLTASQDPKRTQSIMDNAYSTWYFLG